MEFAPLRFAKEGASKKTTRPPEVEAYIDAYIDAYIIDVLFRLTLLTYPL